MATFAACQREYDNKTPDDEYCEICGREASCDCICTGNECKECKKDPCECGHEYCPDCKGIDSCSCDEQYQAYKERNL